MTRSLMRHHLPLIANITVVWAVLFAVAHAYWAAGGSAGMGHPADSAGAQLYIAFVAMLGLVGAAVAWARASHSHAHQRAAVLLARVAGAALLLGVLGGSLRWITGDSLDTSGIVITLYFLIGGVLYSMLGRADRAVAPAPKSSRS
jgi:hypothetical protein